MYVFDLAKLNVFLYGSSKLLESCVLLMDIFENSESSLSYQEYIGFSTKLELIVSLLDTCTNCTSTEHVFKSKKYSKTLPWNSIISSKDLLRYCFVLQY